MYKIEYKPICIIYKIYNKMFQTQGSTYELTGSKILRLVPAPVPVSVLVPETISVPVLEKPVSMLTRKSTLYQSQSSTSTSYVKYGECDDSDSDNDSHERDKSASERDKSASERDKSASECDKNRKLLPSFDNPSVKQAMSTMKKHAFAFDTVGSDTKHCCKKRFPVPGQSSTMNQLFWCVYIACKGHADFDMIANAFVRETEFKYETAELARGGKHLIKPAFKKYKMSLPNFEAELIISKRTTLQLMAGIALCHHKPVLYIDGRLFIEIKRSDTAEEDAESSGHESEYTVIEKVKNRYCVYKDTHGKELARCNNELLKMESIDSPVRSMSYYKVKELEDMYKRLGLTDTLSKKADLYAEVLKYIQSSGITV
jgi:hypothetical protein